MEQYDNESLLSKKDSEGNVKKRATRKSKVVIGIDSSTSCTGYAVLSAGKSLKILDYGKIIPDKDLEYLEKCQFITEELDKILSDYGKIQAIAIEQPNTSRNMAGTRVLCGLYGIIRYMIYLRFSIVPTEINTKTLKAAVIHGNASKKDIVNAINKRFGTKFVFSTSNNKNKTDDDVCDAIGAAYTYISNGMK